MSDGTHRLPWAGFNDGRADENAAIVHELAERGPFIAASDVLGDVCALCGKVDGQSTPLAATASHEPTCLWRRAKSLYPGGGPPSA